jgi:hypothetical protein
LGPKILRKLLQDIIRIQQLGIIHLDVADRQIFGGKLCDFSVAITTPHPITNPELNPNLGPEWTFAHDFETFQYSIDDYWSFDSMVMEWNWDDREGGDGKNQISVFAFPQGRGCNTKYNLRSTPSRERVYTFVDPRLYDWKTPVANPGHDTNKALGRPSRLLPGTKGINRTRANRAAKSRRRLQDKPPRWFLNCNKKVAANLKDSSYFQTSLLWELKDGIIFPRQRERIAKPPCPVGEQSCCSA